MLPVVHRLSASPACRILMRLMPIQIMLGSTRDAPVSRMAEIHDLQTPLEDPHSATENVACSLQPTRPLLKQRSLPS